MSTTDAKILAALSVALREVQKIRKLVASNLVRSRDVESINTALLDLERTLQTAKPTPQPDIPMDAYAVPDAARYKTIMRKK